jgi:hypothetical protein
VTPTRPVSPSQASPLNVSPPQPTPSILRPAHGIVGSLLIAVFWPLNWLLPDHTLRTAYLFFPLWLGYVLIVDALVLRRTHTSLLHRSPVGFLFLFAVSAPAWWLFELINARTQNWHYLGRESFSDLEYFLLATLSFSTVMPAVFGTAELVRDFRWMDRFAQGPSLRPTQATCRGFFCAGSIMLGLTVLWPKYSYPLVWSSVFFILEPCNVWRKRPSLFDGLSRGDWRPVMALSTGALICGFFWEFWNYYSYPKWTYHTPGAQFLHVFEMPLLGYLGYLPFAWELFALRNFLGPLVPPLRL